MKDLLNILIGFGIIFLIGYTTVVSILILTGNTEKTFDDISTQLVVSLVFVGIFTFHLIKGLGEPADKMKAADIPKVETRPYNPEIDQLSYGHYQQESETWWSDSDGDSHSRGTQYACLRFYEDGTVIAKRDIAILKLAIEDSYVYKGSWSVSENNISLQLDKVTNIDDTVSLDISPEEKRDMKYAGHISHDDDLIKAGFYTGTIKGDVLQIGSMTFSKVTPSRLIITASENECHALVNEFKDHPLVLGSFTSSGNWYSNGETGPEWYTVTFESRYELRQELEQALNNSSTDFSSKFWG
jgi:hypothetical protein